MAVDFLKRYQSISFLIVLGFCAWGLYYQSYYRDLEPFAVNADVLRYAQAARNLSLGEGLTTNIITSVYQLNLYEGIVPSPFPFLDYPPLHSIVLSGFFLLFGYSSWVLPLSSGVSFVLLIAIIYLSGKQVFNEKTGFLAALFYLASPYALQISVQGLSEPLYLLLVYTTLWLIIRYQSGGSSILAGLVFALSWLTRSVSQLYLIPTVIFFIFVKPNNRIVHLILFGLAVWITLQPYQLWQSGIVGGYPMPSVLHGAARATGIYDEWNPNRALDGLREQRDGLEFILTYPVDFIGKFIDNVRGYMVEFVYLGLNPLIAVLFVGELIFLNRPNKVALALKMLFLAYFGLVVIFASIKIGITARYLLPLLPLILIFTANRIILLSNWFNKKTRRWAVVLGPIVLSSLILPSFIAGVTWLRPEYPVNSPLYRGFAEFIQSQTSPEEIVISNVPWSVGYYGNRLSIWVPTSIDDVLHIKRKNPNVSVSILLVNGDSFGNGEFANVFSMGSKNNPIGLFSNVWQNLYASDELNELNYRKSATFDNGRMQAKLYRAILEPSLSNSQLVSVQYIPDGSTLTFWQGLAPGETVKNNSEITFEIFVDDEIGQRRLFSKHIDWFEIKNRHWLDEIIALDEFAGREIRLAFTASSHSPRQNDIDWSGWGQPLIISKSLALQNALSRTLDHAVSVNQLSASIVEIQNISAIFPDEAWPQLYLAKAYLALAKSSTQPDSAAAYQNAAAAYRQALALAPADPEVLHVVTSDYLSINKQYLDQELLATLTVTYQQMIDIDPNNRQAYQKLSQLYHAAGQNEQAVSVYSEVAAQWPDSVEPRLQLGMAYQQQGNLPQAVAAYEAAIELNPTLFNPYSSLAAIHARQNEPQKAIAVYQSAVNNNPSVAWPRLELGKFYLSQATSNAP